MNNGFLSEFTLTDPKDIFNESTPSNHLKDKDDKTSCLPSFIFKEDIDNTNEEEEEEESKEENESAEDQPQYTNISPPKISKPPEKILSHPKRVHSKPSESNPFLYQFFPQKQLNSPKINFQSQQFNPQILPQNQLLGYSNNFPKNQNLQPPTQGQYMYTPLSFSYNPVNLMMQQPIQMNNQTNLVHRMSSFTFADNQNRIANNMQTINVPQKKNLSNQGVKVTTYPPLKAKKKQPKKSTADSETISISNLLSFSDNELFLYTITQKGSREMQSILKKINDSDLDILICKLSPHFSDIMIEKYGNYFSQHLIQICSPQQRVQLLKSIKERFIEISINNFGTHPLQSLVEIVNMPNEKEILVKCIENHEVELALDSYGTHVIQKFISCSTEEERKNVDANILANIPKLINDQFGVCVLIKVIKHSTNQTPKETIAKYISENNALAFIQHPYANYAVQSLFNKNDIYLCGDIIKTIVDHFFSLSMQKFSTYVVENCIRYSDKDIIKKVYNDIISMGKLGSMLNNTYGNFVIEKLIGRLSKVEKTELAKEISKLGKEKSVSSTILSLLYK